MKTILTISIISIGLIIIFWFFSKKRLIKKMNTYVIIVKMAMWENLSEEFSKNLQNRQAKLLAGAVVNKLFGEEAPNQEVKNFTKENQEKINNTLLKIKNNRELCEIITQTNKTNYIVSQYFRNNKENKPDFVNREKLKELGIWVSGLGAPNPKTYPQMVEKWAKNKI